MAGSFSQELEDLLNPLPKFADPEDDDEATRARVAERFVEDGEPEAGAGVSGLRRLSTLLPEDIGGRYTGRAVTRRQLLKDIEGPDEEADDSDQSLEEDGGPGGREGPHITGPGRRDFQQLTEGMDELGVSGGEDGSTDEVEDDGEDGHDDGGVCTFSQEKVDEEVEKGKAVKNQLALWDQLLEGRIKIQKALMSANQLPQPLVFPEFRRRGGLELAGALKNSHKALKALQRSLLELHDQLLYQSSDTRSIALMKTEGEGESEDGSLQEVGPTKRKLAMADYPDLAAKRFSAYRPYCDATLQRWHDKTRLNMGKSSRGFSAFDRDIRTQVEQVLMDGERLVQRTRTRRSEYRVLGKKENSAVTSDTVSSEGVEQHLKANTHLKDLDEDIFDDDDFYHQLLRELIERRTSATDPNDQVALGRQWLAIQKLRSKIKKKVDTKASKGRKVRFHVHSKLVNFMAPVDHSSMSDEARSELYRGLFSPA
ncbi:protein AATF [Aulostomus maculatus]